MYKYAISRINESYKELLDRNTLIKQLKKYRKYKHKIALFIKGTYDVYTYRKEIIIEGREQQLKLF